MYLFRVLLAYEPRPYAGRVTLLRARAQPLSRLARHDLGWGDLAAGGVEVMVVPGSHVTVLQEPHVSVLGRQLRVCLARAQAASGRPASPPAKPFATEAVAEEDLTWRVVVNHEGQYSLWPAGRMDAPGWISVDCSGTRQECLAFIKEVWTDLRPVSLRPARPDVADHVPIQAFAPPVRE
jgi:MbtH protein